MALLISLLKAFLVGGAFCIVGQLLIDRSRLTPARILTSYVLAGLLLGALGLYQPLADWAGAGATVPLTGFGSLLARGIRQAVDEDGLIGVLSGGFRAASAGLGAAVFFGFIVSLIAKPRDKGK